jgi:hypothetical protein
MTSKCFKPPTQKQKPEMASDRLETLRDLKKALRREFQYLKINFPHTADMNRSIYLKALRSQNLSLICDTLEHIHLNKKERYTLQLQTGGQHA